MPIGVELQTAFTAVRDQATAEVQALQVEIAGIEARIATHQAAVDAEARVLAAVYLPRLEQKVLVGINAKTGFRGFSRFDPVGAMSRERRVLEHKIAEIAANESYVRREWLIGPHGTITARLAEARGLLLPWEDECARFEKLDGFMELYESKYDTPEFDRRWWQPSYWRIWAAGDAICAALGLADFGDDVLPAYEKVNKTRANWRQQVSGIEAERGAVLTLVQEHDGAVHRLQNLESIYLDEAQQALAAHLKDADYPLLESWAADDHAVIISLRKLAGIRAKVDILQQIIQGHRATIQAWNQRIALAQTKIAKFGRPKKAYATYPDSQMPTKALASLSRSRQAREKSRALADRIDRYDGYDRFSLTDNAPELWYHEMVGRAPGRLTPGLSAWYASHPQVVVVHVDHDLTPDDPADDLHEIPHEALDDGHGAMGDIS